MSQLEVDPAQRIEISAIAGLDVDGLADHLEGLGQADTLVGQHVAEVVQGHGVQGVDVQNLFEQLLGGLKVFLALGQLAAQEEQVGAVFLLGGKRLGLVEGVFGILPAAQADIHLGQGDPDNAVIGRVVEQAFGQRNAFVCLVLVGQLAGQHKLEIAILGVGRGCFARDLNRLVELPGISIGVYLSLVGAHCRVAAHFNHLLVSGDGQVGLVLLLIDVAEPLEEDAAVVLFFLGVSAVGVGGEIDHGRVGLRSVVEAAQDVEQQTLVVAGFKAGGVELARLFNGGQGIVKLVLAALDFGDMDERLRVLGIGRGQLRELLERLVEPIVVEQGLGQGVHGARVAGSHVGRALIGGNSVLGLLQLVVGRAQSEFHFGRAVIHGNVFNDLGGMGQIAAFGVEAGQVQDHFLRLGLDGLRGLELLFRLLGIVLDGVELSQDHAVFDAFGQQGDNLFKFGDGLVENGVRGRGRAACVFAFAELAQVNAAQQLVGVNVVGRGLEQAARGGFGLLHPANAEVEIGERVIDPR